MWRAWFGRGFGPVVRQITKWMNHLSHPSSNVHNNFLFSTSNIAKINFHHVLSQHKDVYMFYVVRPCILEWNCLMTTIMHKFLIYLSIYFCLTCFGLSLSPSSEAGVQLWCGSSWPGRWHHTQETWTTPKLYTCLWRWAKRKPETCKAEINTRR
jgi:hypothetical protein